MNKVLAIIFAVLFAFNAFLCVKSITDSGKGQDALSDAVVVKDGEIDDANEGKLIVLVGKIETVDFAYDEETGLELESALADKHTEALQIDYIDKETNKEVAVPERGLSTLEFNKKYRSEEHWTSAGLDEYVYGSAWVGYYYLAPEMLIPLISSNKLGVETFWQDELDASPYRYYFDGDDIYFTLSDPDNFQEGDVRVSYRGLDYNEDATYTLIGVQSDGILERPDNLGIAQWVFEGEKSLSDLSSGNKKDGAMAAIFFGVLAVVFLVLALWKFELFDKILSKK